MSEIFQLQPRCVIVVTVKNYRNTSEGAIFVTIQESSRVAGGFRRRMAAVFAIAGVMVAGLLTSVPVARAVPLSKTINNTTNQYVVVARNWCGNTTHLDREEPPCGWGDEQKVLAPGEDTPSLQDWDTVRVDAGSITGWDLYTTPDGWTSYQENRQGKTSRWLKIQDHQTVRVTSVNRGIKIRNHNSGLCLAAHAGAGERPVVQTTCDSPQQVRFDQYWQIVPVNQAEQKYRIRSTSLLLCVATRGVGESAAVATTCNTGTNWPDQIWTAQTVSGVNANRFINDNSNLCLAARGDSSESPVLQSTCGNWADQYWR
jgi:hypothetical protein